MRLFLLSLGILFAATIIGYISVLLLGIREPVSIPPLPRALWLSTLVLLTSSVTMQGALASVRRDFQPRFRVSMLATTALGAAFLVIQALCWIEWYGPMRETLGGAERAFLLTSFYVLTGLHALHVIGGLVPMTVVTLRAWSGRYTAANHAGVIYCAMYWHFLDAVWLVLFGTLLIGN